MNNYFKEYDKQIFKTMKGQNWWIDKFKKRKLELINNSRDIHDTSSITQKIGGLLLWQQVVEQFLKEIIEISITYVKAEIWPAKIDLKIDYDKKTFGQIIELYKNNSMDYNHRPQIVEYINTINNNRNKVVHKMFEVDNLDDLNDLFESSYNIHEKLLELLLEHYILIAKNLEDLKSEKFKKL